MVVTNNAIKLTENERVQFITGDVVAELQRIKEDGDGTVVAYGEEIGALLLDNGLADEITVTTVPILVGGDEKALKCGLSDGGTWIVRSNKMLVNGKCGQCTERCDDEIQKKCHNLPQITQMYID